MAESMSEGQGGCCGDTQNAQRDNESHVDAGLDARAVIRATLPVPTNESCCSTGVARDEIAGTNGSREIGGLGQVLTLVATRDHGGVTAGCGCSPDRDASVFQIEGQAPLGIDTIDRSPLDFVSRDDVANIDAGLADDESGSPQCCVDGQCQECGNAGSAQGIDDVACCGGGCCGTTEDKYKDDSQYSTGAGHESGHVLHGVTEATR